MSVYSAQEICNIVNPGEVAGVNPDIRKYEQITDSIADLLRNSDSHDRFTPDELCQITDCFIMLKRKATSEEKRKVKCRFSRYEEMHFKYQEARLKAHAVVPETPKRVEVPAKVLEVLADASTNVAEYAHDWVDDFDVDLSKSVVLEKKLEDNIV